MVFKCNQDAREFAITQGVLDTVPIAEGSAFLARHLNGDWGDIDPVEQRMNKLKLAKGGRIISQYTTRSGIVVNIISTNDGITMRLSHECMD